jgi:hypothetical protein
MLNWFQLDNGACLLSLGTYVHVQILARIILQLMFNFDSVLDHSAIWLIFFYSVNFYKSIGCFLSWHDFKFVYFSLTWIATAWVWWLNIDVMKMFWHPGIVSLVRRYTYRLTKFQVVFLHIHQLFVCWFEVWTDELTVAHSLERLWKK